jgi:hypothetical protein
VVFTKAMATGAAAFIDCTLMPHSDTIVIPASAAIDNIEVRPEVEPLAMALMGTALTNDNVIGVDPMCGSTDPASLGRIQLAMQVAAVIN